MTPIRAGDGCVHFSELKAMAKSPAHYRHACLVPRETTRAMRVGALADAMLFDHRPYHVYEGDRRGKAWDEFKAKVQAIGKEPGEIYTRAEADDARGPVEALLAHPRARHLITTGEKQVHVRADHQGRPCAGTLDLLGEDWIADVKVTNDAEPGRWMRHAIGMMYHAQLALYAALCGRREIREYLIVGVEATPPHPVTILSLDPEIVAAGARAIVLWIERLRQCEEADEWPGYVQADVRVTLDDVPWIAGGGLTEEEEAST